MIIDRFVLVFGSCLVLNSVGMGSGPLGHVVMARHVLEQIQSGAITAPAELKAILKDPDAARAYCGGAVGPDLDDDTHYKRTSELPARMLATARKDLASAQKAKSPARIKAANLEIAFSYGWLNHCAADLSIHPGINAVTGDTFRYNSLAGQAQHAQIEGQYTAFLSHGKPLPAYDPMIPAEFVHRTTSISLADIDAGAKGLASKAGYERTYAETAGYPQDMSKAFKAAEDAAMSDNGAFIRNPVVFKDWDLDCGKISTAEFETLREATMRANGGKLPANWGAMYLSWDARTNGLVLDKKIKVMTGILGGAGAPPRVVVQKPNVPKTAIPKGGAWVLQSTSFTTQKVDVGFVEKNKVAETGSDGMGSQQSTFGHPDPSIFVTVRIKVAWTQPERTLIPGKTYRMRFAILDAGSDDPHGLFLGGNGSLGSNCPALGDVWYGPHASIDLKNKVLQGEQIADWTPRSAPVGSEMVLTATWTVGMRGAYFTYLYKFVEK